MLSWCSTWQPYMEILDQNLRRRIESVVIIPRLVWRLQLAKLAAARGQRGLVTWVIVSERSGWREHNDHVDVTVFGSVITVSNKDSGFSVVSMSEKAASIVEQRARSGLSLYALAGTSVNLGCINANVSPPALNRCFSAQKNSMVQALKILNCTVSLGAIHPDHWLDDLYSDKVDVITSAFGLTEGRYGQVYATVNRFGGACYYVPKRTRASHDFLLSILPLASLLLLALVACVVAILLANKHSESLWQLSQDAVLALVASVFLFSSPLQSKRTGSRIVLAAWMAAGFSLAAYTQSLLTASVTAGARWEADDTLDKVYPKLQAGELLPCVVARTYFDLLLREAGAHRRKNVIDVAAAVRRRRARTSAADDVVARNHETCLKRVARGTHMYLTTGSDLCLYRGDSRYIAEGKEVLSTIVGGYPMRNDYHFRREIAWLTRTVFEAGWDLRLTRKMFWSCPEGYLGGNARAPASPLDARQFVGVFYGCCCVSLASLAAEILCSWIYREKRMSRGFGNGFCIFIYG
ncbi:hypothetical protein HPB49_007412 [Dermacentor silvarum]|uniref:Uncharacterized protein n=1 Tax=Dermacentor silvarum TaxID=543639 RepID=A0ACB8D3M4_DERSI|nr:hypothetical protein HPB49_007412 [Dermacentor silvarum]